jgi:hypothetical protein
MSHLNAKASALSAAMLTLPILAPTSRMGRVKGWLLIETLAVLLLANALVWFIIAQGWPK